MAACNTVSFYLVRSDFVAIYIYGIHSEFFLADPISQASDLDEIQHLDSPRVLRVTKKSRCYVCGRKLAEMAQHYQKPTTTTLKYTFQYLANVSDSPDRLLNFELLSDRIEQVNSTLEVKGTLYYHNQSFYDLIFSQQRSYRGRLSLLRASPFGLYFCHPFVHLELCKKSRVDGIYESRCATSG